MSDGWKSDISNLITYLCDATISLVQSRGLTSSQDKISEPLTAGSPFDA